MTGKSRLSDWPGWVAVSIQSYPTGRAGIADGTTDLPTGRLE